MPIDKIKGNFTASLNLFNETNQMHFGRNVLANLVSEIVGRKRK